MFWGVRQHRAGGTDVLDQRLLGLDGDLPPFDIGPLIQQLLASAVSCIGLLTSTW